MHTPWPASAFIGALLLVMLVAVLYILKWVLIAFLVLLAVFEAINLADYLLNRWRDAGRVHDDG